MGAELALGVHAGGAGHSAEPRCPPPLPLQGLCPAAKIAAGPKETMRGARVICVYTNDFDDRWAALGHSLQLPAAAGWWQLAAGARPGIEGRGAAYRETKVQRSARLHEACSEAWECRRPLSPSAERGCQAPQLATLSCAALRCAVLRCREDVMRVHRGLGAALAATMGDAAPRWKIHYKPDIMTYLGGY